MPALFQKRVVGPDKQSSKMIATEVLQKKHQQLRNKLLVGKMELCFYSDSFPVYIPLFNSDRMT